MTRPRLHWRRYAYIARKYWRMNPLRPWWLLHLWDEVTADLRRGGDTYRAGIRTGRRSAASEIRSAILDLLHPDDPPGREYALRQCVEIAERAGGLDPIPNTERT